ncbi:MAG: Ig-like domain-containing protein [Gemmatimonadota bacterium]
MVATCRTPRLEPASARPFDWIAVHDLPAGFDPVAAEVTTAAGPDTLLAPVVVDGREDRAMLQVPIHPSFERTGGEVSVRIYVGPDSCDPVPLTIAELEAAPGAMAEAARELRSAMNAIVGRASADLTVDEVAAELAESPGKSTIFAVPALWALDAMAELERLVDGDSVASESPADAEMLDAVASRLALATRMQELHSLALVTRELAGDLTIEGGAGRREARVAPPSGDRRASAGFVRLALHAPMAPIASASPTAATDECPADQFNLFQITDPAELDNLMRAQHYAERFYAGAKDQDGGSASGTVFGDIGVLMGAIGMVGGRMAGKVWSGFSEIVLNTAEAYSGLLPGEMALALVAEPSSFEEDSEETGRWTAAAVATSEGMRLTKKILEKVMTTALKKGLGDVSVGKPLKEEFRGSMPDGEFYDEVADRTAKKIDKAAKKEASAAVKRLLDALGAEEGPDWFDIPGGCWELTDMAVGGGAGGAAAGDPDAPPLLTAHLSGPGVAWTDPDSELPREYAPAAADTSRLEVRTVEDYRKALDLGRSGLDMITGADGLQVATTYAFGGQQHVAVTRIEVRPIEIDLNPTIVRVEPGDNVPFEATVRNALDTRVRWTPSVGHFDEIVDFGEGTHEAHLPTPTNPEAFPIRVEVESVSQGGIRSDGEPERNAVAWIQTDDPVVAISPLRSCLAPGDTLRFAADLLGVGDVGDSESDDRIRWSASGGRVDGDGLFRAPSSEGTYEVTATYGDDSDGGATATVQVGADCCGFRATVSAGPEAGPHQGPAWLLGRRAMVLGDVSGKWETRVVLPDTEPGEYESEMEVITHVPHRNRPGETVGIPADAPDGRTTHPVTVVIERTEGNLGMARADGSVEGYLSGRAGWRKNEGDIYFDLQASFKAVPYSVSPRGRYQQCREGWGLESSGDMMRRLDEN